MSDKTNYEGGFGSNALKDPQRVVFITPKTSAKVQGVVGKKVMAYPNLLLREAIALEVLVIALVLVSLFWDAPLEQLTHFLLRNWRGIPDGVCQPFLNRQHGVFSNQTVIAHTCLACLIYCQRLERQSCPQLQFAFVPQLRPPGLRAR